MTAYDELTPDALALMADYSELDIVQICADWGARIAAVRKLHVRNANSATCEHCSERDYPNYEVPWPCPTMLALGEQPQPPKCPRCKGHGVVPDWSNWNEAYGEPRPKPCPDCTPKEPS